MTAGDAANSGSPAVIDRRCGASLYVQMQLAESLQSGDCFQDWTSVFKIRRFFPNRDSTPVCPQRSNEKAKPSSLRHEPAPNFTYMEEFTTETPMERIINSY
jgi:hypothetical protein